MTYKNSIKTIPDNPLPMYVNDNEWKDIIVRGHFVLFNLRDENGKEYEGLEPIIIANTAFTEIEVREQESVA